MLKSLQSKLLFIGHIVVSVFLKENSIIIVEIGLDMFF